VIVIPRKKGESVVIDGDIILTVIEVRGDKVRFRIQTPGGVSVQKHEAYESVLHQESWRAPVPSAASQPEG
jgi:carbon storage regulator